MKPLTRNDIAKAAGVSPSTVSRALAGSDLLPQTTIDHVCKIAGEMGYKPNILGRRLATNRSFQIGFVVPLGVARRGAFQMSYFSHLLDAMVTAAFRYGYSMTIHPYEKHDRSRIRKLKELVLTRQVDGLVFVGLTQNSKIPSALTKDGVPFVLMGSRSRGKGIFSVNCNPEPGLREMLKVLQKKGYKRLFFAEGDQKYHDARKQKELLLALVEKSRLSLAATFPGNYSRRSGYAAAEMLMKQKKANDAILLANDRMAVGFYRYCQEHGVTIPREIGVIGSDDDEAATALFPDLSTIHQPRTEMGEAAIELLIDIINKKKEELSSVVIDEYFIEKASI